MKKAVKGEKVTDGLLTGSGLLDFAMNKVHEAAFLVDRKAHIHYVNDNACEVLGYTREELLSLTVADIDPDYPSARWKTHWTDLKKQSALMFEGRHRRKDGSILPVEINANYFTYAGKEYNLAFVRNITKRKHEEEVLQRMNRELEALSNCNQALLRATDEQKLLSEICRIICDKAGYSLAWVGYAMEDEAKTIRPVAWAGHESGYIEKARLSWSDSTDRGRGPAGQVIRSGKTIVVQDFTKDLRMKPWRKEALQRGYQSGIALPLKDENSYVFGALLIYSSMKGGITSDEIHLMEEMSSDLSYGIASIRSKAERLLAQEERMAHLRFVECMDAINRIIQGSGDLEKIMGEVLDNVLEIFNCDRAFLLYPCDPSTEKWNVSIERNKAEYPGVYQQGTEILIDTEVSELFTTLLANEGPVRFGPGYPYPLPSFKSKQFEFKCLMSMALRPKVGKPWQFGIHQCSHVRSWTEEEVRLFQEIGRRLEDGLTSMLSYQNLLESEKQVRRKLEAILSPDTDISALELSDIIDSEKIQHLMDEFYRLTNVGIGIIDLNGKVLVGTGWQDICTKFHRINPDSCRLCIESDLELSRNVTPGTFKQYRCKLNMWDIATPIMLRNTHVGNIFLGQFLFDDETPDFEIFRQQARRFGFDEKEYISALDRVPRWSHEKVESAMSFYAAFAGMIGNLSYSNIKLANALEERKRSEEALRYTTRSLSEAQHIGKIGSWELDLRTNILTWSDEIYRMFEINPAKFGASYEAFLDTIHPDDREMVNFAYTSSLETKTTYSIDHRLRFQDGRIKFVHERCETFYENDKPLRSVGTVQDITERKYHEEQILKLNRIYSVLSNINQAIIRIHDKQKLFDEVCRIAVEVGKFRMTWIGLVNEQTKRIDVASSYGFKGEYLEKLNIDLNDEKRSNGPTGQAVKTMRSKVSNDVSSDVSMLPWREDAMKYGFHSVAAFPLVVFGKLVGSFTIYESQIDFFEKIDIDLLDEMAKDISFALEFIESESKRHKAENQLRKEVERGNLLLGLYKRAPVLSDKQLYDFVLEHVVRLTDSKIGFFHLVSDDQKNIILTAWNQEALENCTAQYDSHYPIDQAGNWVDCVRFKHPVIYNDFPASPNQKGLPEGHSHVIRFMSIPVMENDKVRFIFGVGNKIEAYNESDLVHMQLVANELQKIINHRSTEKAFQESEKRYREIFENTTDIIFICDVTTDGRFMVTDFNPACEKMIGIHRNELIGRFFDEFNQDNNVKRSLRKFQECIEKKKPLEYIEEAFAKAGHWFLDTKLIPVKDENDRIYRIISISSDVTEQKLAEQAKEISEEKTAFFIHISNIFLSVPDDEMFGEILSLVQNRFKSPLGIFGYIGENGELNIPSLRGEVWDKCRISEKSIVFPSELWGESLWGKAIRDRKPFCSDGPFKLPQGHLGINSFLTVPILFQDWTIGLISLANKENGYSDEEVKLLQELTNYISPILHARVQKNIKEKERRLAMEALQEFKLATEQSPVTIVITDIKGNIEYVNPKFTEISGYEFSEVKSKNPRILQSGEKSKEDYKLLWATILRGDEWKGEFHNKRKDGTLYWEMASISSLKDENGAISHFIAIKEDITRLKQMEKDLVESKEKAEEMSCLKSSLLLNMSHELRTPMNGILGFSSLLKEKTLDEDSMKMVDVIHSSGNRLMATLNSILNLAQAESGILNYALTPVHLSEVTQKFKLQYKQQAENKGINFYSDIENNIYSKVDKALYQDILHHLFDNAVKFTDEGTIRLTLKVQEIQGNQMAVLSIQDSGIGIKPEEMAFIFDAFRQASEGIGRSFEGTGLGLTLCKKFVELLNGTITVDSHPGIGTIINVFLPVCQIVSEENIPVSVIEEIQSIQNDTQFIQTGTKPRILIVEDNEENSDLMNDPAAEQRGITGIFSIRPKGRGTNPIEIRALSAW